MKNPHETTSIFLTEGETKVETSRSLNLSTSSITQDQLNPDENLFLPFENCLVDHCGRQFACVHTFCQDMPSCFRNSLLEDTLVFQELNFHPDDRRLWCEMAFPDILRLIRSELVFKYSDYRFIFNHRYIRKDGSVSQFMHEGELTFPDDSGMPFINLKAFSEIADIKSDETMIMTIFRYSPEDGYRKVFSKVYSMEDKCSLSDRELEVIMLCQKGLSSKMIAEKLNLSIHTVKNHKRNCMTKTNTHNITELIHLCIQKHWL